MKQVHCRSLGERFYCDVLPCGLELHILPKRELRNKHAMLAVDYGSIHNSFVAPGSGDVVRTPHGVAHFLEHRLFEKPQGDISERFAALGADVNAHSGFTDTAYFFSTIEHFAECLNLLLELVLRPHLTVDGVEREREIIAREIQLYSDSLEWVSFSTATRALYREHPIRVDMAGTLDSIRQIDRDLLEMCYRTFYRPGSMSLFASGDVDADRIRDQVWAAIDGPGIQPGPAVERIAAAEPPAARPRCLDSWLPIVQPRVLLGFRDPNEGVCGRELLRRELALDLALDIVFGPGSDFYSEQYERGLIDADSFGYEIYAEPEFSFCLLGGDASRPERLVEALIAEIEAAPVEGLIEKGFARARRKAYGHLLLQLDQVESCASFMHSAVSRGGRSWDLFEVYEGLVETDVRGCLETWLDTQRHAVACIRPAPAGGPGEGPPDADT